MLNNHLNILYLQKMILKSFTYSKVILSQHYNKNQLIHKDINPINNPKA
jgi:hypothetical protein